MEAGSRDMRYDLELRRNVLNYIYFGLTAVLLLIPPFFLSYRSKAFEAARWQESDYAPKAAGGEHSRGVGAVVDMLGDDD